MGEQQVVLDNPENTFVKTRALQKVELSQIPAWNTGLFEERQPAKKVRKKTFSTLLISVGDSLWSSHRDRRLTVLKMIRYFWV